LLKRLGFRDKLLIFLILQVGSLQVAFTALLFSHSCLPTASVSSCASGTQQLKSGPSTPTASQGNLIYSGGSLVGISGANTFSSSPSGALHTAYSTFWHSKLGQSLPELARRKEDEKPKPKEKIERPAFKRKLGRGI